MNSQLLGTELRRLRLKANMTLEALAATSGVSVRGIGDLERGLRRPRKSTLRALADGLRLDSDATAALMGLPASEPSGHPQASRPAVPNFTGRSSELALLMQAVRAKDDSDIPRVVVVSGASGFGKTALAMQTTESLADVTVGYVDATGFDASASAVRTLLTRLQGLAQVDLVTAVRARRAATKAAATATVLDNVGSEALARALISSQVGGAVLITSRRPLQGLEDASRVRVGPLPSSESSLLLARSLGEEMSPRIERLAQACEGIPGALVVTAGLVKSQGGDIESVIHLLDPPSRRLRSLTLPWASMIIALQNSYSLLRVEAAAMLRTVAEKDNVGLTPLAVSARLGVHVHDVEDALEELVDYGMLEVDADGYRLLEIVRLFARGFV